MDAITKLNGQDGFSGEIFGVDAFTLCEPVVGRQHDVQRFLKERDRHEVRMTRPIRQEKDVVGAVSELRRKVFHPVFADDDPEVRERRLEGGHRDRQDVGADRLNHPEQEPALKRLGVIRSRNRQDIGNIRCGRVGRCLSGGRRLPSAGPRRHRARS